MRRSADAIRVAVCGEREGWAGGVVGGECYRRAVEMTAEGRAVVEAAKRRCMILMWVSHMDCRKLCCK